MSLLETTVTLSSSDLLNLSNTPFNLVAAQGTGTIINPIALVCTYNYNGVGYYPQGNLTLSYGGINTNSLSDELSGEGIFFDINNIPFSSDQIYIFNTSGPLYLPKINMVNQPIQLIGSTINPSVFNVGSLNTVNIVSGGNNYAPGDTGVVYDTTGIPIGNYTITSVDDNGSVTSIDTPNGGVGFYIGGPVNASVSTGSGDGTLTLSATSITNVFNGSVTVQTVYMVHNV